jgi:hypothetical protein
MGFGVRALTQNFGTPLAASLGRGAGPGPSVDSGETTVL